MSHVACVSPAGVAWSGAGWRVDSSGVLRLPRGRVWTWSAHELLGAAAQLDPDALGRARPRLRVGRDGTVGSWSLDGTTVASLRAWLGDDDEPDSRDVDGAMRLAADVEATCADLGCAPASTPGTLATRVLDEGEDGPRMAPGWASIFAAAPGPLRERLIGGRVEALDLGEEEGPASYWDRRSAYVAELLRPLPVAATYRPADRPDLSADGMSWATVRVPADVDVPPLTLRVALPHGPAATLSPVGTLRARWTHAELRYALACGAQLVALGPGIHCDVAPDARLVDLARRILAARARGRRSARGLGVALVGRLQGSAATRSASIVYGSPSDMTRALLQLRRSGVALGHLRLGGEAEDERAPGWFLRTATREASAKSHGAPWVDAVLAAHVLGRARTEAAMAIVANPGRVRLVATDGILVRGRQAPRGVETGAEPGAWVRKEYGDASRVDGATAWALRRRGQWEGTAVDGWDVLRVAAERLPWDYSPGPRGRPAVVAGRAPGGGPVRVELAGTRCPVPVVVLPRRRRPEATPRQRHDAR